MTDTSADLYWNAVPNATTYQIFKNGVFDVSSSNAHELDRSLTAGTSYTFVVKAEVGTNYYESEPLTVTTTGTAL
ncbi:hypothetical protein IV498_11015 [Paenarthrobacter sp. Z7-10]|uniref:hypothetical protein n=1 Tax=Paenarthrobacter sp. Z7-10 TaxID=2787635 RepID=UPI0022A90A98|nr:hypothetical protein [Paenarthrobacter sp. Z7-10]MCZ2403700.1 hypothetical protein [Paenarthrobacter sp. Z7-10]